MSDPAWDDALLAAKLFAIDPGTGLSIRALPGPVRDRLVAEVTGLLPPGTPVRRVPLQVSDDRLLGGLDLTATLQSGRPVAARGLLAEANGGIVLLAMAERVSAGVAARVASVLDTGEVVAERDGMALRSPSAVGVLALDEGIGEDERPPAALLDRLAFHVDLTEIGLQGLAPPSCDCGQLQAARLLMPIVQMPDEMLTALGQVALGLGVASMRALLLAVRAARAAAALGGRRSVLEADATVAARLVLASRATRLPAASSPESQEAGEPGEPQPAQGRDQSGDRSGDVGGDRGRDRGDDSAGSQPPGDIMLEAARAALPPGLLARLLGGGGKLRSAAGGKAGALQQAARRGRPIGVRRGALRSGARLDLLETLRAAAPWQRLRGGAGCGRVRVLPDDIRITRFRQRTETTTIFLVDASGSAALNRLAEAKGAVELVLADCYVRRDRVALIGFRGAGAELLLPPTGSLVRAKRSLAALPGGGGTPLAAGLDAALALADAVRRRGQTPVVILLSDGRANVARNGLAGRQRAEEDALSAGRSLRAAAIASLLVDTSPRPAPQARQLAGAMGAQYLPLPYADATAVSRAIISGALG